MAILSAKQREALTREIQTLSMACKLHIDAPEDLEDNAHKTIVQVIRLTRVLLSELTIHEFIASITNKEDKEYYMNLVFMNEMGSKRSRNYLTQMNHEKV